MISEVRIYRSTPLTRERNLKIDGIEQFLNLYSPRTYTNFQYIKNGMDIEIKIDRTQREQDADNVAFINYCRIENLGNMPYYYFVDKITPRGESTILLSLHLDVINTFRTKYESAILPSSVIHRQHMDRFAFASFEWSEENTLTNIELGQAGTWAYTTLSTNNREVTYTDSSLIGKTISFDSATNVHSLVREAYFKEFDSATGKFTARWNYVEDPVPPEVPLITFKYREKVASSDMLRPLISYTSEGINPVLFKTREDEIAQVGDQSWNLIYRNDADIDESAFNETNPVTAWLCGDRPVKVSHSTGGNVLAPADFATGWTMIRASDNGEIIAKITYQTNKTTSIYAHNPPEGYQSEGFKRLIIIYRNGNDLTACSYLMGRNEETLNWRWHDYTEYTSVSSVEFINPPDVVNVYESSARPTSYNVASNAQITTGASTEANLKGIDQIDRKDAKLIKIIKLPFPPTEITFLGETYDFGSTWEYDTGDEILKASTDDLKFDYLFRSDVESPLKKLEPFFDEDFNVSSLRHLDDPKLLNSAFYRPKFVYDSFTFEFDLELVDAEKWIEEGDPYLDFRFVTSTTFNSKFAFIFPDYFLKYSLQDYDNVLPVGRNNELPIFSSQYVTYLRTAYRYDLKELSRKRFTAGLQAVGSVAGGAIGLASSVATGRPFGAVASFGGMLAGATNAVLSAVRAEDSLKSKMESMENQAVNISASDDIDILTAYSGNKCKVVYYEVSPLMKTALNNLFHYCGYSVETSGIPDETSRIWFNFVQADIDLDIEFSNTSARFVPSYAIPEIKARYASGLTILHNQGATWNPQQDKENYERSLFE